MTPDEINRAIAEHLGWVQVCHCGDVMAHHHMGGNEHTFTPLEDWPDYYADLNACHSFELRLQGGRQDEESELSRYITELTFVCAERQTHAADVWDWDLIHATPQEKAEAFLRTIGKWVEPLDSASGKGEG